MPMLTIPSRFQRVICPWQTPREIDLAVRAVEKVLKKLTPERAAEVLRLDSPERDWERHRR